jgi:hypothetical protein
MRTVDRPGRAHGVYELGLSALERLRPRKDRAATMVRLVSLRRAIPVGARARRRDFRGRGGARPMATRPGKPCV